MQRIKCHLLENSLFSQEKLLCALSTRFDCAQKEPKAMQGKDKKGKCFIKQEAIYLQNRPDFAETCPKTTRFKNMESRVALH